MCTPLCVQKSYNTLIVIDNFAFLGPAVNFVLIWENKGELF